MIKLDGRCRMGMRGKWWRPLTGAALLFSVIGTAVPTEAGTRQIVLIEVEGEAAAKLFLLRDHRNQPEIHLPDLPPQDRNALQILLAPERTLTEDRTRRIQIPGYIDVPHRICQWATETETRALRKAISRSGFAEDFQIRAFPDTLAGGAGLAVYAAAPPAGMSPRQPSGRGQRVSGGTDAPVVAVLDTGVANHAWFTDLSEGRCFSSSLPKLGATELCSAYPNAQACETAVPWCAHGTHTAGGVVQGVPGLAILPIQVNSKFENPGVCNDPGPCVRSFESDRIRALEWVYLHGSATNDRGPIRVAYLGQSAGAYESAGACEVAHECMKIAIDNLWRKGIAVVVPVGNDHRRDALGAPSCLGTAISVGATDDDGDFAPFTNAAASPWLDVVAPGSEVETAKPCSANDCTVEISGTSMAAARVAAVWARLRDECPTDADVEKISAALRAGARTATDDRNGGVAEDIPWVERRFDWDDALEVCAQ